MKPQNYSWQCCQKVAHDYLWLLAFVFYQTAFPFLLMCDAFNNDTSARVTTNCIYGAIVFGCALCTSDKLQKLFVSAFYAMSLLPNVVVLGWYFTNHCILKSTDFWVIFDTNPMETAGFLQTLSVNTFLFVGLYVLGSIVFFILALRHGKEKSPKWLGLIGIAMFAGVSLVLPFRAHCPNIDLYKSFYKYQKERREVAEFFANRKNIKLDARCYFEDEKKTFVIVIGESASRKHYGCYGYVRNTTPMLDSLKNELVFFDNVISPHVQTLVCMKQTLTFSNRENPDLYKREASIVEILKNAGYKTYWLDNQGVGGIDTYTPTSYRSMAKMCDYFYVNERSAFNESLLPKLDSCLNDTAQNKVIFLHLMGSHFAYSDKYTEPFRRFTNSENITSPFLKKLKPKEIDIINHYDNSIAYNDFCVANFILQLQKIDGSCVLLYFSDHGEEVFDYDNYSGRSTERLTRGLCEIPFVFWQNEIYQSAHQLVIDEHRPYCTSEVIHTIMDLTGVDYVLKDTTQSLFRQGFVPKTRYLLETPYEDLKK